MKIQKLMVLGLMFLGVGVLANQSKVQAEEYVAPTLSEMRGEFRCPAPSEVKCKTFADSVGNWTQNGGYRASTDTAFVPNDQCANVIAINENGMNNRLLCCYKECGVLFEDVKFHDCKKTSVSTFSCR